MSPTFATRPCRSDRLRQGARTSSAFPSADFNVIEMPEYARGTAGAYADMPGPLENDQRGFYDVSCRSRADWTPRQTASFLREYNKWVMHELTLHEGVPGHLLQLAHSNQYKSTLRAFLASGPMVEGWACYGQDVMADDGLPQPRPALPARPLQVPDAPAGQRDPRPGLPRRRHDPRAGDGADDEDAPSRKSARRRANGCGCN